MARAASAQKEKPKTPLEYFQTWVTIIAGLAGIATPVILYILSQQLEEQKKRDEELHLYTDTLFNIGKFLVDKDETSRQYGTTLYNVIGQRQELPQELTVFLANVAATDPSPIVKELATKAVQTQSPSFAINTSSSSDPAPRVYFQIRTENQRVSFENVRKALAAKPVGGNTLIVPGIEKVPFGPLQNELRYFVNDDKTRKLANDIVDALYQIDNSLKVSAKYVPGYDTSDKLRPNHFELWVTADAQ